MRIFGEDITAAGRDAAAKKKQQGEATPEAPQVDEPVLEDGGADASENAGAGGIPDTE